MSTAEFLSSPALAGLPHGFFTRRGGVSQGGFASLNCALSGADDPADVAENRALAMAALGLEPAALVGLHQVHGPAVVTLRAALPTGERPKADGMVTDRPGLALGIITADCGPVLFADAEGGVVGACHAGWRGAVAGVCEAVLDAMEAIGARRERVTAVLGPCIRQVSYEVGDDLRDAVLPGLEEAEAFFAPGHRPARWQFDMAGYIAARLERAGTGLVRVIEADTCADEARFFSYRRRTLRGEGPIGHQLSAIALPR